MSSISQPNKKSNSSGEISLENSSGKDFALDIDSEGENISGAEVMSWLNKKPEGDDFTSPTISTVGKVKNAKAIIQKVRSTPHQAQSMIGSVQYNVFEADKKNGEEDGRGIFYNVKILKIDAHR